jgi:hypothetical protein
MVPSYRGFDCWHLTTTSGSNARPPFPGRGNLVAVVLPEQSKILSGLIDFAEREKITS